MRRKRAKRVKNNDYSDSEIRQTTHVNGKRIACSCNCTRAIIDYFCSRRKKNNKNRDSFTAKPTATTKRCTKIKRTKWKKSESNRKKWNENEKRERLALAQTLITFVIIVYDHFSRDTTPLLFILWYVSCVGSCLELNAS